MLTVREGVLHAVIIDDARDATRRLPGTFLHEGELLGDAVRRSLTDKAGIDGLEPVQLHVFDALDRDSRTRVLSVAHMVAVPESRLWETVTTPVDGIGPLAFDHAAILAFAVTRLRADYSASPDPWDLLGPMPFTLRQLESMHRSVDPQTPLRDTFRRSMESLLIDTGERERGTVGKPARLFTKGPRLP